MKRLYLFLIVFSGFFFPLFSLFFVWPGKAKLVDKIVQPIGEKPLSLSELDQFQSLIQLDLLPPSLLSEQYTRTCLIKSRACLLDFLSLRNLLSQLPERKQLPEISDQEIESALKKLKGDLSDKAFLKKLKRAGLSLSSLKKEIAQDLQNHYFLQTRFSFSGLSPTDADLDSLDPDIFNNFEYEFVSLSFSESQKPAILKGLKKGLGGESLKAFASKFGLKTKKFKLMEHELGADFRQALKKLSISQISPLLYIGESYYLLQLKWKSGFAKNQAKKAQLEEKLFKQKQGRALSRWMEKKQASMFLQ